MGECQSACSGQPCGPVGQQLKQSIKIEYNGEQFIMPEVLSFSQPTTFFKVERAARQFCEKNNISTFYSALISRIIAYRQDGVFQYVWNTLPQSQRDVFLEDLNAIEHDLMDSFYHTFVKNSSGKGRPRSIRVAVPKMTKESQISQMERQELAGIGQEMLRQGKVAAIFMCAGASSRFDGSDKFLADLGLSQSSCMLDFAFMRLKRNFTSNTSPLIIMNCSDSNLSRIQNYLKVNKSYGLDPSKIRFFINSSHPVIDRSGKYCVDERFKLIRRSAGTATCAEFLLNHKMQELFKNEGIQYVYFSGMENLMENPCDPLLLGMIKTEGRKIAAKCVGSSFYSERRERYCYRGDSKAKIELLNCQDFSRLQNSECLVSLPIAVNSMVFSLPSLQQIMQDYRANLFLAEKYHVIAKQERIYNVRMFQTEHQLCYSFQKDLRDIISCSDDTLLLRVSRKRCYVPICSRGKEYAMTQAVNHFSVELQSQLRGWPRQ